ncbi:MAG: protein kinase domain-containing protein [Kiritimatiellia bacterium]
MTQEEQKSPREFRDVGIATDPIQEIACSRCGCRIDVRGIEPFAQVQCPDCGHMESVPARLGHFLLLSLLGTGGMGGVFQAEDETLRRLVAIKVMLKSLGDNPEFVETFKREAQAAAKLNHPNIAQIYSFGQEKGQPYIVMELVSGKRFDRLMEAEKQLDQALVMQVALDISQGLQVADENGLVHGDIKPENILLDEKMNAKLVDFGLAAVTNRAAEGGIWGTPYYIPPEKVLRKKIDARSDIYSLGATIYHALAGQAPFEGETPAEVIKARLERPPTPLHELRPDIKKEVEDIVSRMLQPHPAQRYPNYTSLISDVQKALKVLGASPGTRIVRGTRKIVIAKKRTSALSRETEQMAAISDAGRVAKEPREEKKIERKTSRPFVALMGIVMLVLAGYGTWKFLIHEKRVAQLTRRAEEYRLAQGRQNALALFTSIQATYSNATSLAAGIAPRIATVTNAWQVVLQTPPNLDLVRPKDQFPGGRRGGASSNAPLESVGSNVGAGEDEIVALARSVFAEEAKVKKNLESARKLEEAATNVIAEVRQAEKPWTVERRVIRLEGWLTELRRLEREITTKVAAIERASQRAENIRRQVEKERLDKLRAEEEAARQREEEERQKREAERLRALAEAEKQRATAAHVEVVELIRKNQFEEAYDKLSQALAQCQTEEGKAAMKVFVDRVARLKELKAFLIKRMSSEPLKWGWGQGAAATDVLGADASGVKIKLGTVPWKEVSAAQMVRFVRAYLADKELRATVLADLNLAVAIYCEENGAKDLARQFADKAVDLFPSLAEEVKRLLPEEGENPPTP